MGIVLFFSNLQLQEVVAYLTGDRPEFWESSFVAQNKGREGKKAMQVSSITFFLIMLIAINSYPS